MKPNLKNWSGASRSGRLTIMSLSREDVLRLAQLARLELTPEEVERYQAELGAVLAYVAQLQELKSKSADQNRPGVELRPDTVQPFADAGRLVAQAPEHDERFIVVPPVFDEPR